MAVNNLVGTNSRRCLEKMPAPTEPGQVPVYQENGTVIWAMVSAEGIDTDDQIASEVPIDAIVLLPGSTNVQEALEELATQVDGITDTDDQTASEVPIDAIPDIPGALNVQEALEELAADVAGMAGTDDQTAAEVPITAITALPGDTNVQEALETLAVRPYRIMAGFGDTATVTTGDTLTFRAPDAFTITGVRASLATASSSGVVDVDVKKNGVTIFSTRVTIDASETTSVTAATPSVLSTTAVADNDELQVEVIDDGTGAEGLVVTIRGTNP